MFLSAGTGKQIAVILADANLREGEVAEGNVILVDKFNHHYVRQDVGGTVVAAVLGAGLRVELADAQHCLLDLLFRLSKLLCQLMHVGAAGQVDFI